MHDPGGWSWCWLVVGKQVGEPVRVAWGGVGWLEVPGCSRHCPEPCSVVG